MSATTNNVAKINKQIDLQLIVQANKHTQKSTDKKNKTVVTKEEARNMERRMSRLVGNNQQHCKDKQTKRLAIKYTSKQPEKQRNTQKGKCSPLKTCKIARKLVFLINCLMGNWQEVGCSGGWMGRSISLPTPITGPRSRGHFLGRFTTKSGLIKTKRQICTRAPKQALSNVDRDKCCNCQTYNGFVCLSQYFCTSCTGWQSQLLPWLCGFDRCLLHSPAATHHTHR